MGSEEIEFDAAKNETNVLKHGVDLKFGARVLSDPALVSVEDTRKNYGETRWQALGAVEHRVYVVVHTRREYSNPDPAKPTPRCRIISVRKANARETRIYRKATTKS